MKPRALVSVLLLGLGLPSPSLARGLDHPFCATYPGSDLAPLLKAREAAARRGARSSSVGIRAASVSRSADVAVLVDGGDLILPGNPLDLQGKGLEFRPGYTVTRVDRPLGADGAPLTLGDDDTREVPLPFAFPFFGASYDRVFVNSDGNLTFGAGDNASTTRNLARLVSGPPRIAPLLADFDPGTSGKVSVTSSGGSFTAKWTDVPQWGKGDRNTFEVTLYPDGRISFAYDASFLSPGLEEGAAGIAAGGGDAGLATTDLSTAAGVSFAGAVGESFRAETDIDLTAVARAFYAGFGDDYQQLIVYTNRGYIPRSQGAFAYETTVRNSILGLGSGRADSGPAYGSPATLESVVLMDSIEKYSASPASAILREETTLSVLAHEVGHRWLATAKFMDNGSISSETLGRQQAHWSFFMNSSGSHDEGNAIADMGGGVFRTGPASQRYGPLDQYLMGLRAPEEVPPFFIIRSPQVDGVQSAERAPQSNVDIRGTRKDITIADVIAANGPRVPAPAPGAAPWRVAFLYVTQGDPADASKIALVETIRSQFEGYFLNSTEGRRAVETHLR